MSIAAIIGFGFGALGPCSMAAACVFEYLAKRLRKNPRCDKTVLGRRQSHSDVSLVAAWLLWAAMYLCFYFVPEGAMPQSVGAFETWVIAALLVLDIVYLALRRSRPRQPGQKKHFWEI